MTEFPNTREGAMEALRFMAQPHRVKAVRKGTDGEGHWMLEVTFAGDDEPSTVAVYLAPHHLGTGPFNADFETLED